MAQTDNLDLTYKTYQQTGQLFQHLLETKAPDPATEINAVSQGILKLKDITECQPVAYPCNIDQDFSVYQPTERVEIVPKLIKDQAQSIGIEPLTNNTFLKVIAAERESWTNYWEGIVAPGAIFIEQMFRKSGPFASEISRLMYCKHFSIESLKHIFLLNIINPDTKGLVTTQIYAPHNGLAWPDPEPRVWGRGTPEYEAILGTKLGRLVARLVIGSFEPGSRRILQITTWCQKRLLHIRFDLELESSCSKDLV
ncbi:uncharacterized protein N7483_003221 [Penicillium malachiteum]|uniref:uncharacterized protein n=1 Tax=Penicillium malachiteum TaxID=1324776 RepID=UPI00254698D0|nr:uncharacterized protein N7483_003221 [Penicillium malachiteum]KAJ5728713.1 hypothetical protein N7483_003221 [Penicillium malachiteum]